jgi:hypothetical protein
MMPMFDAMPFRDTFLSNAHKAIDMQKKALDWQLDQAKTLEKSMREQGHVAVDFGLSVWKRSAEMGLEMQKQMVEAMAPKAADKASA